MSDGAVRLRRKDHMIGSLHFCEFVEVRPDLCWRNTDTSAVKGSDFEGTLNFSGVCYCAGRFGHHRVALFFHQTERPEIPESKWQGQRDDTAVH